MVFGPVTRPLYTVRLKSFEDAVEEEKTKDNTERKEEDPWSINGVLTKLISSQPNITIYYSEEEAKMVDKETIARNSGKGCDASNVYDEEVQNTDEMYFSDDEQEREARRKGKSKKGQRGGRDRELGTAPSRGRFQRDSCGRGRGHFNSARYNQLQTLPSSSSSGQNPLDQRQHHNYASQYPQNYGPLQNHYLPNTYMAQQYPSQPQQYMSTPQYPSQPQQYMPAPQYPSQSQHYIPAPQQYIAQSQQYPTQTQHYSYQPQQHTLQPHQQYPNQAQQQVYPQTTQQYQQNTNVDDNINQKGLLQNTHRPSNDHCDSEGQNDTVYYDYSRS